MFTNDTFYKANNKDADQTARMRRLLCACVACKPPKTGFLETRPIFHHINWIKALSIVLQLTGFLIAHSFKKREKKVEIILTVSILHIKRWFLQIFYTPEPMWTSKIIGQY